MDAEPEPIGCWVTYAPCGCRAHAPYMPAITGLMERHPRGAWITHWGPGRTGPRSCQTSGRVTGVEPCTDRACPWCAQARVDRWTREHVLGRGEYPRADPNPDRPPADQPPAITR